MNYDPRDWYWIVAGDATKVYSSARGDYFPVADATYAAWVAAGGIPTSIVSADELADVLANVSVRPANADLLDRYKGSQASRFTLEVAAKIALNHENRLRALESKQPVTAGQLSIALKAML